MEPEYTACQIQSRHKLLRNHLPYLSYLHPLCLCSENTEA
jgi:hypothetical protein